MSGNAKDYAENYKLYNVYKFESFWKKDEIKCGFDSTKGLNNDGLHHNSD
jgi:hypothetical protein